MEYIVDRIEGEIVVLENCQTKILEHFPKDLFPEEIKDGDLVILKEDRFEIEEDKLKKLNEELEMKFKKLFGDEE